MECVRLGGNYDRMSYAQKGQDFPDVRVGDSKPCRSMTGTAVILVGATCFLGAALAFSIVDPEPYMVRLADTILPSIEAPLVQPWGEGWQTGRNVEPVGL